MDMAMTPSSDNMRGSTPRRGWFSATDPQQEQGKRSDESSQRENSPGRLGFWLRLLLLMFLINLFFSSQSPTIDLSYSRFLHQVERGTAA